MPVTETKFNKAVGIIQNLPSNGPIEPTQEEKLYVRTLVFFWSPSLLILISRHTPQPAVLRLLQARCVLRGAITGHLGPHFPRPFRI